MRQPPPQCAFPEALPAWFIRLFTAPGDTVLDPFAGSGTTLAAATTLHRQSIGIEIESTYEQIIRERCSAPLHCEG